MGCANFVAMNLTIDIGNTSAKAAVFDGETMVFAGRLDADFGKQLAEVASHYLPQMCAVSNVAGHREDVEKALAQLPCEVVELTWESPVETFGLSHIPQGLGADRLAAVLGATALMPNVPLLVIDAGTCLTYDYIAPSGRYLGGNISPGLSLRLRAMHEHTALLPLIPLQGEAPLMGEDTDTALRSGVVNGACFEIEGFLKADRQQRGDVQAFFAGADALPFSAEVRPFLHMEPRLVGIGLNRFINEPIIYDR